jgi:transcriptional regulator with XRE-family HTH domain
MPVHMGIGNRIRAARERLGMSREALAYQSDVSWSAIAQIESGRRTNVRPRTLAALAGTLGVTIDYLVSGAAESSPMLEHRALLYETESDFDALATPFVEEALQRSEAVFVIARSERIRRLRRRLGPAAKHVEFAVRGEFYTTPVEVLGRFREFNDRSLRAGAPWIRFLGEPVWEGDVRLWARFESLLNLVFSAAPVTAACSYSVSELGPEIVKQARATHPHCIERAGLYVNESYLDPSSFVLGGA